MSLDWTAVGAQVKQMGGALRATADDRLQRTHSAWHRLSDQASRWEHWQRFAHEHYKQSPWLLAAPAEPMDALHDLPTFEPNYTLAAVDGSQIDLDRHGAAECFLINLGLVVLRYGKGAMCTLRSEPQLHYREDEIVLRDDAGRSYSVAGALVHAERDTREGTRLAQLALTLDQDVPQIAFQDGTLIRWPLSGLDPWVRDHFLRRYLDDGLDILRQAGIPTCAYISRPRTVEIAGLIRLINDPELKHANEPANDMLRGITDEQLLRDRLQQGQRSALFKSLSRINVEHYGEHAVHFFYVNIGRELARIEVPEWVAQQPAQLDLVHALAFDQAQRGGGYPVALTRAHEQAVVRETDRRVFRQMINETLWHGKLADATSMKQDSKQHHGV